MRGYLRERDRRRTPIGAKKSWQMVVDNGTEVVDGVRSRKQVYRAFFGTRREAENALRVFVAEVESGGYVRDRKLRLDEYLEERWLPRKKESCAYAAWVAYASHVRYHIVPAIGAVPLAALRRDHVRAAIDTWARKTTAGKRISPKTVNHIFGTLRSALRDAQEDGLISALPFTRRMVPSKGRAEVAALDESELLRLFAALDGTPYERPTKIAAFTGLRQGELLALRWENVDLEGRVLRVVASLETVREDGKAITRSKVPKTPRSRREVPLSRLATEVLRRQRVALSEIRLALGGAYGDEGLVFPSPLTGQAWAPRSFSVGFGRLVKKASLATTFHGLRHSYASIQIKAGSPLTVVSGLLGHSTVGVTGDVYAHVLRGMNSEAADRLDAAFEKALSRR